MKAIKLDKDLVTQAVSKAGSEVEAIESVYKMVYPELDKLEKVGSDDHPWPTCNQHTWTAIVKLFMDLTTGLNLKRDRNKGQMPGGVWLNNGFTTQGGDQLADWYVMPVPVTMKKQEPVTA